MYKNLFTEFDFQVDETILTRFHQYYEILVETNKVMNLTAITEEKEVYIKHFYDSLLLSKCYNFNNPTKLLDVGSGAGFPSIPLAICYPNLEVVIIDALDKRIKFINSLAKQLGLINVRALHVRAEDYAKDARESFDVVTARAVARLNMLAELCLPLVKVNGYFIPLKGPDKEEEREALNAIKLLGAKAEDNYEFKLPEDYGERTIYRYKKILNTPKKYPRSFKLIKANPLR